MQPDTLIANLSQFTGTETWHRRRGTSILYTDGVRYLADNANAWWLVDAIASHQANPRYTVAPTVHASRPCDCAASGKGSKATTPPAAAP